MLNYVQKNVLLQNYYASRKCQPAWIINQAGNEIAFQRVGITR